MCCLKCFIVYSINVLLLFHLQRHVKWCKTFSVHFTCKDALLVYWNCTNVVCFETELVTGEWTFTELLPKNLKVVGYVCCLLHWLSLYNAVGWCYCSCDCVFVCCWGLLLSLWTHVIWTTTRLEATSNRPWLRFTLFVFWTCSEETVNSHESIKFLTRGFSVLQGSDSPMWSTQTDTQT